MSTDVQDADPRKIWKAHCAKMKDHPVSNHQTLTVGLAGSLTMDPLVPYLGTSLLEKGFSGPRFTVGLYNQIYQLCLNPDAFFEEMLDVIVILWRLEDLMPESFDSAADETDRFLAALKQLRAKFAGTLIVSIPPYPNTPAFDVHDLEQANTGAAFYHSVVQRFTDGLNEIGGIKPLLIQGLLMQFGFEQAHDVRKAYLYKQPYTESFWNRIGQQLARIIAAQTIAAKKCIVLDCDNTLWGGIVGEDGLGGIAIGTDFPGSAFRDFQKYMLHLRSKGLFLAVASKNNEEDVFEVFDTHDAMVLKRDHISVFEVHWKSKVESLKNIAAALNIGTDALVFVDDNPKEIAEVQERLPDVTCLMVPEEPAYLPDLLRNTGLFDIAEITDEDRKRADMMMAEGKRKDASSELSEADFIKSLELKIKIFEAQPQHMARVTQLINKTNQFNVTTIRRTQEEVETIAASDDHILLGMDIRDRFGEYGLVGVTIAAKESEEHWHIDSLMMSCRVLGRGAETSMIAKLADVVRQRGGKTLSGEYIPTQKNALVKNLFADHKFKEDGDRWIIGVEDVIPPPDDVEVTLDLLER